MDHLAAFRSKLKASILVSLLDGPKRLADLRTELESRETSILHVLKDFESTDYVIRNKGTYELTSLGYIEAQLSDHYESAALVTENFRDFWSKHEVEAIPINLLVLLGALRDAKLITTENIDLQKIYDTFFEILSRSEEVKGISPIFHPSYVPVIEDLLGRGKSVELILTHSVLNRTVNSTATNVMQKALEMGLLKIYLKDGVRLALTVTDKSFSLGLFDLNGVYDDKMDLIAVSPEAISWGDYLFKEYLNKSQGVTLQNLL